MVLLPLLVLSMSMFWIVGASCRRDNGLAFVSPALIHHQQVASARGGWSRHDRNGDKRHLLLKLMASSTGDNSLNDEDRSVDNNAKSLQNPVKAPQENPWIDTWFPLLFTADTDGSKPTQHWLLGAPLVVWKSSKTQDNDKKLQNWFVLLDQCPHRLVPLSEGRVINDGKTIECPYHGWTFEGSSGACTNIPQQQQQVDNKSFSSRACATALPCAERQGILWVHSGPLFDNHGNTTTQDIDHYLVESMEQEGVLHVDYMRDLPMEWTTLAENVMDPSHLPHTHHDTIGNRNQAGPFPLRLTKPVDLAGIQATRDTQPNPGSLEYRAPHLVYSGTYRQDAFADWNVAYAVPTLPGKCRLLVRIVFQVSKMKPPMNVLFNRLFRLPSWMLHMSNHKILEDDNIFLHHQTLNYRTHNVVVVGGDKKDLSYKDSSTTTATTTTYLPTDSDQTVIAFRRWLQDYGMLHQMWSRYTPEGAFLAGYQLQSRNDLINRDTQHTSKCSSCVNARQWLQRIQSVLGIGAFLATVRAVNSTNWKQLRQYRLAFVALVLSIAWKRTGCILRAMKEGNYPPPRNRQKSD